MQKDMQAHLEKIQTNAAECKLISDAAADQAKRELFTRLAKHLTVLADELRQVIAKAQAGNPR